MIQHNIESRSDHLILMVDDVLQNLQLLGKILDNNGYRVAAVSQGEHVLNTARKHWPDLILLDIMMPGKSGYEVCEELKADEELADIPVIFLTARSEEEDIIKGFNFGGSDYVTKPFNSGELLARIQTHISLKEARDRIAAQQQELQQLLHTRDRLYSIIAHDLRGALAGINGITDILQQEIEEKEQGKELKEYIRLISDSANTGNQILENLLSWTRLQTDELQVDPQEFTLSEVIDESVSLYRSRANNKNVEIAVESTEPGMITADKQMISTVIRNLVSNAIKFSESGDRVSISLTDEDKQVKIRVQDQGTGMKNSVLKKLFNPEDRPKTTGTAKEQGTGLGLMLCKEYIEAHEGDIHAESTPGEGSVFHLSLPREQRGAEKRNAEEQET